MGLGLQSSISRPRWVRSGQAVGERSCATKDVARCIRRVVTLDLAPQGAYHGVCMARLCSCLLQPQPVFLYRSSTVTICPPFLAGDREHLLRWPPMNGSSVRPALKFVSIPAAASWFHAPFTETAISASSGDSVSM